jgi:hypothetical protein
MKYLSGACGEMRRRFLALDHFCDENVVNAVLIIDGAQGFFPAASGGRNVLHSELLPRVKIELVDQVYDRQLTGSELFEVHRIYYA